MITEAVAVLTQFEGKESPMRFFAVLASLGILAACNTAGTTDATYGTTNETLGQQIAQPTDGFENETSIDD